MLEILVVMGIVVVVLGAVLVSWRSGTKSTQVATSTAALQNAMLLTEALYRDICQLGVDQTRREPLLIADGSLSFYKVKFLADAMHLVPVKFSRVKSPRGNWLLKREELGEKEKVFGGAACAELAFGSIVDPQFQTQYVRVTMKVLDGDLAPGPGRRDPLPHSAIMRVPVPSQVALPGLQAVMRIVPDGDLMPLDPGP